MEVMSALMTGAMGEGAAMEEDSALAAASATGGSSTERVRLEDEMDDTSLRHHGDDYYDCVLKGRMCLVDAAK